MKKNRSNYFLVSKLVLILLSYIIKMFCWNCWVSKMLFPLFLCSLLSLALQLKVIIPYPTIPSQCLHSHTTHFAWSHLLFSLLSWIMACSKLTSNIIQREKNNLLFFWSWRAGNPKHLYPICPLRSQKNTRKVTNFHMKKNKSLIQKYNKVLEYHK